jgi:hypothetical protein
MKKYQTVKQATSNLDQSKPLVVTGHFCPVDNYGNVDWSKMVTRVAGNGYFSRASTAKNPFGFMVLVMTTGAQKGIWKDMD